MLPRAVGGVLSQKPGIPLSAGGRHPSSPAFRRACKPTCSAFDRVNKVPHVNGVPPAETIELPRASPPPAKATTATPEDQQQVKKGPKKAIKTKEPPREFINTNRYWVASHVIEDFESEWRHREAAMMKADGFLGLSVDRQGEKFKVSSRWKTIPQWEAWSCSPPARRSHMPVGVFQYVPDKGEGFPDDFVPFKELTRAVNAKY